MIRSDKIKEFDPTERLYCSVASAILGAGALGAGASIFGATTAANAQTNAANAAIANQKQVYGANQANLNPFIQGGANAIPQLVSLLNPSAGGPNGSGSNTLGQLLNLEGTNGPTAMNTALASTPGYQFNLTQGNMAVNNALAARGLGGSGGAVAKGAANYTEGLAGNTWQSVVQALQGTFNSQVSGTQNLVNTGTTAASSLAGVGTSTANAISGALGYAGNAQANAANASGTAVANQAYPSGTALAQLLQNNQNGSNGLYSGSQIPGAVGPTSVNGGQLLS